MAAKQKATDAQVIAAYEKTGSVWDAGALLGMGGQSVHERLKKLGIGLKFPPWTLEHDAILQAQYLMHRNAGTVQELAKQLGRTKQFVCRQAGRLGLTDKSGPKPYACVWKGMSRDAARVHFEEFRASQLGVGEFCRINGFDKLGFTTLVRSHFLAEWNDWMTREVDGDSAYHAGRKIEYVVLNDLRGRGYFALISPASKGPMDLIGVKVGTALFIQAKKGLNCGVSEWNALYDVAVSVGAIPILAGTPAGALAYRRMTGRKSGRKTKQPMEEYFP